MVLVLLAILCIGLVLIATEAFNRMNKAAVAMFAGVCCWMLFIIEGRDFVSAGHLSDFGAFAAGTGTDGTAAVKEFISTHLFARYAARAADIVLYLLATTTIVEVLNNNGCFDFVTEWLRTRHPAKLLWLVALVTAVLSANLDNLATAVLMLGIVHPLLGSDKARKLYGAVIVLAANCGGAVTVIGDITSLKLWTEGLVTPTQYFLLLAPPALTALVVSLALIQRDLPRRIYKETLIPPYRGDDTLLTRPQRLAMLFVGVGGLWFVPTFHRLTLMPPFVGAMCVLGLLWIVNEVCNRQLLSSDTMVRRRLPMALQYANVQNILFFIGVALMFGAVCETGALAPLARAAATCAEGAGLYVLNAAAALASAVFGNVPALVGGVCLFHQAGDTLPAALRAGGDFWPLLSYATAVGGSLLSTGTVAGYLLMRMEDVSFGWYLRHITPKVAAGYLSGLAVLWLVSLGLN